MAACWRCGSTRDTTRTLEKYLPHRPLKIGICPDILARCPVLTRRELGTVLGVYASRVMYLQSLVAGAIRIDLDGNPAGEVSAADAAHAAATLAGILASRETRRAAAMAAKRAARDHERAAPPTASPTPLTAAPTAKVLTLKERPVLRLPAFRQQQKRG